MPNVSAECNWAGCSEEATRFFSHGDKQTVADCDHHARVRGVHFLWTEIRLEEYVLLQVLHA